MKVRIYLYATLRELARGKRFVEVNVPEDSTVLEALLEADRLVPGLAQEVLEDTRVREGYKVMVSGRDVDFEGGPAGRRLRDGEEVHVFPPVAGG